jgi:2'-5' RNA ligase
MRLFFALFPPALAARALHSLARAKAAETGGKPSRAESIHLTLAFLGEVPDARLAELIALAEGVRAEPFDLAVDFCGHWRHNRLLWAGCNEAPAGLVSLANALRGALAESQFVVDKDPGRFVPHVTLVRKVDGAPIPNTPINAIAWRCTGFDLVLSPLGSAAVGYRVLASFPLE